MNIRLEGLGKTYGGPWVIQDASLVLDAGKVICLIGLNGAGKTTLIQCLGGLLSPSSGRILYEGEAFDRSKLQLRKRLFYLPDFPICDGTWNGTKLITSLLHIYERDYAAAEPLLMDSLEALDILNLMSLPLGELSRGQFYKVWLCALRAIDPELWLLDEPFASGIDPRGLSLLKKWFREAAGRGRTLIFSTQILELARSCSDELLVVHDAKLHHFATIDAFEKASSSDGFDELMGALQESKS